MRNKTTLIGSLLPAILICTCYAMAGEMSTSGAILPEVTTAVDLSSTDVNRITCTGEITDLIFSSEKGVEGHFTGNNAFVKFKLKKVGNEEIYSTRPTELFVVCGGSVYTLIGTPKRIPSVTLRLSAGKGNKIKKNMDHYEGLPFEKKILRLIREAYRGEYPDSYRVTAAHVQVNLSADLRVSLKRVVDVEGEGFRLKEYSVTATPADEEARLAIQEKDFLRADIGEKIIAIAVERQSLAASESTRVFVVEKKEALL